MISFVKNTKVGGYLTMKTDDEDSVKFMGFRYKKDALNCVRFITKYRYETGNWPVLNVKNPSAPIINIERLRKLPEHIFVEKNDPIYVVRASNAPVIICDSFGYVSHENEYSLSIKGQVILPSKNPEYFLSYLEEQFEE